MSKKTVAPRKFVMLEVRFALRLRTVQGLSHQSFCELFLCQTMDVTAWERSAHESTYTTTIQLIAVFAFLLWVFVACILVPVERMAEMERQRSASYPHVVSARAELRRRGSF